MLLKHRLKALESELSHLNDIKRRLSVIEHFCINRPAIHDYNLKPIKDYVLDEIKLLEKQIKEVEADIEVQLKIKENKLKDKFNPNLTYHPFYSANHLGLQEYGKKYVLAMKGNKLLIYHNGHTAYINRGETVYSPPELYWIEAEKVHIRTFDVGYAIQFSTHNPLIDSKKIIQLNRGYSLKKAIQDHIGEINKFFDYEFKTSDFHKCYVIVLP